MKLPRPAVSSARPWLMRSMVANCWKTRTGSSVLRTVTALPTLICRVCAATAASTVAGEVTE